MMKLTAANIQNIMKALRDVAEKDSNDVIANRASDLAWRLEGAGTSVFNMSNDTSKWKDWEYQLAQYAFQKQKTGFTAPGPKRKLPKRLTTV